MIRQEHLGFSLASWDMVHSGWAWKCGPSHPILSDTKGLGVMPPWL